MRTARPPLPGLLPALGCIGLIALVGLASCARTEAVPVTTNAPATTEVTDAAPAEPWPATPPRVEVSNFNGRIDLVVDDRLTAPTVEATSRSGGDADDKYTLDQLGVTATLENGVYRVVASRQDSLPAQVSMHLAISVPSAGDISVYNRGGPVKILNAGAGVQVENGRGTAEDDDTADEWLDEDDGPWIQLRTAGAIDKPVALVTDSGDVAIIVGPQAKGAFDLQAPAGEARANARVGTFDQFKARQHFITGRYNNGTNPVLLRTETGNARALMIERPDDYTMRMW